MKTSTKEIDRTKYIGGSDAGAILNRNDYRSRQKVWADKVYGEDDSLRTKRPIMRGNRMEEVIEEMVRQEHDPSINSKEIFEQYHKGRSDDPQIWLFDDRDGNAPIGGHPDGIGKYLWELKAPAMYTLDTIKTNGVPESWIYQVQHYLMMVPDVEAARIAALDYDSWQLFIVEIPRSVELQNEMLAEYDDFWFYVENEIEPPMLDNELDLSLIQDTKALDLLLERYTVARDKQYEGKDQQGDLKGQILSIIRDTPVVHTERFTITQSEVNKGSYSYKRLVVRPR